MSKSILLVLALLCTVIVRGQEEATGTRQWEQLAEQQEEVPELDETALELEAIQGKPVRISSLTTELLVLLGLSPVQIQSFQNYVRVFGYPTGKYELQAIPYWDKQLIQKLAGVLDFSPLPVRLGKAGSWYKEARHQLLVRSSALVQKTKGFHRDSVGKRSYEGSPQRLFIRYGYELDRMVQAGFSLEKDAGEAFGKQLRRPADFTGFHLYFRGKRRVKAVALGDFAVNAGQGLVVWQGLAFGKGAAGAGVFRQGPLLKAYRSAGEINFFRGAAIHLAAGKWEVLTWISNRKRSASIIYEQENKIAFSSLATSGYHRTDAEIAGRKQLGEMVAGSVLKWQHNQLKIGINQLYQRFSLPWQPREEAYSRYYFKGKFSAHHSLDYNWGKKQFFLFGELARGAKGIGLVQGLFASVEKRLDLTMVYRNFQPGYHSVYANVVSEQAAARNEEGLYTSIELRPAPGWQVHVYADYYRFPWLRFRSDAPGNGNESRILVQWEKRRSWLVYGYFRVQTKPENLAAGVTNSIVPEQQQNLRLHIQRTINKNWLLSARMDRVKVNKAGLISSGWGVYADAKWVLPVLNWQFTGRVHWFQTDGYESRLYSYERDVLYSYSVPAIFDHGLRYYVQCQGRLAIKGIRSGPVKWWIRWSQTGLSNQESIGSGQDEIPGNRKSEWKFQVMLDW